MWLLFFFPSVCHMAMRVKEKKTVIHTNTVWASAKSNVCFKGAKKHAGTMCLQTKSAKPTGPSLPPEKRDNVSCPTGALQTEAAAKELWKESYPKAPPTSKE